MRTPSENHDAWRRPRCDFKLCSGAPAQHDAAATKRRRASRHARRRPQRTTSRPTSGVGRRRPPRRVGGREWRTQALRLWLVGRAAGRPVQGEKIRTHRNDRTRPSLDDRPEIWDSQIKGFNDVLDEDLQFGSWIQKAVDSYAFDGVPLSYQEARIYHWHQEVDKIIGLNKIRKELRVEKVMGDDWTYPNDMEQRLKEYHSQ